MTNETINLVKRMSTEREITVASYTFDRRLISRIYKNSKKQGLKNISDLFKRWARDLNTYICTYTS